MSKFWFWLFVLHFGSGCVGAAFILATHDLLTMDTVTRELLMGLVMYSYAGFFATIVANELCKAIRSGNGESRG